MSKESVLKCLVECSSGILTFAEIQSWCKERQLDDTNLQDQLQCLVDNGEIGHRTIESNDGKEHIIYWSNDKAPAPVETTVNTPATPIATKGLLGTPHSSRLRERLKRSRQRFVSPLLTNQRKKPKLDGEQIKSSSSDHNIQGKLKFDSHHVTSATSASLSHVHETSVLDQGSVEKIKCPQVGTCKRLELLGAEKKSLETKLAEKKETLRKLKMVKLYRSKNDLQGLKPLTREWREVSQEAAEVLLGYSTLEPRPSMAQLLEHFHIDVDLIHYSLQEEAFC